MSTWLLTADDLVIAELVRKLCDTQNATSAYLRRELQGALDPGLADYCKTGVIGDGLPESVLDALNDLIDGGKSIYDPDAFEDACVTDSTMAMVNTPSPAAAALCKMNRLLLAEAYPCCITTGIKPRSPEWHKYQVDKFSRLRPRYEAYAGVLKEILGPICKDVAPLAIVDARAKEISSFAEKAWRKEKYVNPICNITDLCGARVITETQEEADKVCAFIRKSFAIDEVNSIDRRTEVRVDEFGYMAVHYVVQIDESLTPGLDPGKAKLIRGLEAEIQVKTLLQHAWASISHDRIYKSQFEVPRHLKRDLSRVAALLEDADAAFGHAIGELDRFKCYYRAYMTEEQMRKEIETLETILRVENNPAKQAALALNVAQIHKAIWEWGKVVDVLRDHTGTACREADDLRAEYWHAVCQVSKGLTDAEKLEYAEGQKQLISVAKSKSASPRTCTKAWSYLGWTYGNEWDKTNAPAAGKSARDAYKAALQIDPSDPYVLSSCMEFELGLPQARRSPAHASPMFEQAIALCRSHAEAGIELPWAYFTIGRFYLMMGRFPQSLAAYAAGTQHCLTNNVVPVDVLDRELQFLRRTNGLNRPVEHQWVDDLLFLARSVKTGDIDAVKAKAAERHYPSALKDDFPEPVVIVAGGAAHPEFVARVNMYRNCLHKAFKGFKGTFISGGTSVGVPGIVGEIADLLGAKQPNSCVAVVGYRPEALPDDAPRDERYTRIRKTTGSGFTLGDPLETWFDLIAAGIQPSEVSVLGINGGRISKSEFTMALGLGATVGIIQASGRTALEIADEAGMYRPGSLLWLPLDISTVRAFVNPGRPPAADWEKAGRKVHADYVEDRKYSGAEPNLRKWEKLSQDLQDSNTQQAQYCAQILMTRGFKTRPYAGTGIRKFDPEDTKEMAKLEHGRWIVERLKHGWRYGPVKDVDKKISPYIVPWDELSEEVRGWDRGAVEKWPDVLQEAGLEVYR